MVTLAPASAAILAAPSPIPDDPPTIRTRLSLSDIMLLPIDFRSLRPWKHQTMQDGLTQSRDALSLLF
jgi:hypothetical protein